MNLSNCSISVDPRADDGQFTSQMPGETEMQHMWVTHTSDGGVAIRLDGGIQLAVTVKLTTVALRDIVAMLQSFLDSDARATAAISGPGRLPSRRTPTD